jgi:RsmE family RNA methyltransferase
VPRVNAASVHASTQLSAAEVWVLVGPEGGLSGAELALLAQHDVAAISLGRGILRVETACVVACAQLLGCMRERA